MEKKFKNMKHVEISEIGNCGLLYAHEYSFGNTSEGRKRLNEIEYKMKTLFSADNLKRKYHNYNELEEHQFVAVNPSESKDWYRGYITRKMETNLRPEYKTLLIDYGKEIKVSCNRLRPLSVDFGTKYLDSQVLKIVLYGVMPAFLEISIIDAGKTKLRKSDYWCPKDKTYLRNVLRVATAIYFEEIRSTEELSFGILYLKRNNKEVDSLQDLLVKNGYAIECSDFEKEIPLYIKKLRRSHGFYDSKLAVRKDLYPSIQFSDNEEESNRITRLPINHLNDFEKDSKEIHTDTMSISSDSASRCNENHLTSEIDSLSIRSKFYGSNKSLCESTYSEVSKLSIACTVRSNFSSMSVNALVDKILIVGRNAENNFKPVHSLMNSRLDSKTKQMLQKLKITDLNRCQKYMIPAMLTGQNVTLIDGPGCGKTLAALIALVSLLRSTNTEVPSGVGPRSIILCPYSSHCEWIEDQCLKLITGKLENHINDGDDIRVNVAYGCGTELERQKLEELIKGYDILICTPRCLLRLLAKEGFFNFRRLSHIIFEEIHILLKSYFKETCEILEHTRKKSKPTQRIMISNYWIPRMKPFTENGLILISCYLDAALFVHLKSVWKFISNETRKINSVLDVINNEAKEKNLVILFNEDDDLDFVYNEIRKACSREIYKIESLDFLSLENAKNWTRAALKNWFPILLCTDFTLLDLNIYQADCLIHYSLPSSKSDFVNRFCVLLEHLETASKENFANQDVAGVSSKRPETYIYSSSANVKQFPVILEIMEKLRAEVPPEIKDSANKLLRLKELEKQDTDICTDLKEFGRCVNKYRCEMRHEFLAEKDQPDIRIPKSGYVKVHITHVYSPTHFAVRLLEHKTESGTWKKVESHNPGTFIFQMSAFFSKPDNVRGYPHPNLGDVVAVEISHGVFKRAKVLKLKDYVIRMVKETEIKEPRKVTVKLLDEGRVTDFWIKNLIELPPHFASIPSPIVDVFLCNLLPVDEDSTWGEVIKDIIKGKINDSQKNLDNFFYGKIQLVLGSNLWLHPFECKRVSKCLKDSVLELSVTKTLLAEKWVVSNKEHLLLLKDKCKLANIAIIDEANKSDFQNAIDTSSNHSTVSRAFRSKHETVIAEGELTKRGSSNVSIENESNSSYHTASTHKTENDFVSAKLEEPVQRKPTPCNDQTKEITFKPPVEWKQDHYFVYLTVNVNSENFIVDYSTTDSIYFKALIDDKIYEFKEKLFACVVIENSQYYKSGVTIRIKLSKLMKRIKWQRLFKTREQLKWVRFDLSSASENEEEKSVINFLLEKNRSNPAVYVPNANVLKNECKYPDSFENFQSSSDSECDDFPVGYDDY